MVFEMISMDHIHRLMTIYYYKRLSFALCNELSRLFFNKARFNLLLASHIDDGFCFQVC